MTTPQDAATALAGLDPARTPWLALALTGPPARARFAAAAGDATVIDITDPGAVPVTVNPLEPGPGCPVQVHADRLAGLFEAAFGLAGPVAGALRVGLRQAYADGGWDLRTGGPGPVRSPAVPSFRQLKLAILSAAAELGYGARLRAAVRAFLTARLDPLWAGPAGRFLEGGHPVGLARLLGGNVLVTGCGVADTEAAWFLAGVLLLRLAGQLSHQPGRLAIVIATPGEPGPGLPDSAWFGRLTQDLRLSGADVVVAPAPPAARGMTGGIVPSQGGSGGTRPPGRDGFSRAAVTALLAGRRSAACGDRCRRRPCDGYEMHAASLLADDHGQAWLRLWAQALVLAFLTARPVPRLPVPLRSGGQALSPRGRDCLLATVVDAAIATRAAALRPSYDPDSLTAVIGAVAGRMLTAGEVVPLRPGSVWVIPQLRWLHEMERLNPFGRDRLRPDDIAPPLDFGLAGLPDWPGIRVADRLGGLLRHPLAMEAARNRTAAGTALLGADGGAGLDADLATAGIGISPPLRLRHAARLLGAGGPERQPGWLEVVLSWPRRFNRPASFPAPGIGSGRDEH